MTRGQPSNHHEPADVQDDTETLRRAVALVRALRDPALPGILFLLGVVVAGVVALTVTVINVAATPYVALQTPHIVSGGVGSLALIAVGTLLAAVQAERRDRVLARVDMRHLVDDVSALVTTAVQLRKGR